MKLIDWLAAGQVWFDNEYGEALTISSLDPDTSYPVEFRWNSGGLGRNSVEGFIGDNTPRDLVAFLRDRALTATGPGEPAAMDEACFTTGACPKCTRRWSRPGKHDGPYCHGDRCRFDGAATGPGSGAGRGMPAHHDDSADGATCYRCKWLGELEALKLHRVAAPQTDHRAAPADPPSGGWATPSASGFPEPAPGELGFRRDLAGAPGIPAAPPVHLITSEPLTPAETEAVTAFIRASIPPEAPCTCLGVQFPADARCPTHAEPTTPPSGSPPPCCTPTDDNHICWEAACDKCRPASPPESPDGSRGTR